MTAVNLDLAQKLSLVERNLQAAQVNIDSAVELLGVVLAEWLNNPKSTPVKSTPVEGSTLLLPKKKLGRPQSGEVRGLIRQYIKTHEGPFSAPQILAWSNEIGAKLGTELNLEKVRSVLYQLATERVELVSNHDGTYSKVSSA